MRNGVLLLLFCASVAYGHEESQMHTKIPKPEGSTPLHSEQPFVIRKPYTPPTWDYGAELGSFWHQNDHYWMGISAGRHIGKCMLSDSETCQQYVDAIGGVSGRMGFTHYSGLLSLRWQFVNFPAYWAPLVRIMGGATHSIEPGHIYQRPMAGIGIGFTTFLHPKADLRMEARAGTLAGVPWGQAFISIQFRMDEMVKYFAEKLKDMGVEGVLGAGELVKTTVETTGSVVGGAAKKAGEVTGITNDSKKNDKKKEKPQASPSPTVSPSPTATPKSSPN